ncbi:MAG: RDD family protein [Actinobacteria bacterium]|jgi:uncharacterized RDD family membrane protein YckC|uniref:Unannotated protein n=1 Tax=freshwater metagenome TaxID=449393 RepID=A0A6J6JL97_9ZZZZ|nr:RDD family protein [Actinomycetota bacterium]
MLNEQNWAGKSLGLPESGPGSLAKIGRRLLALSIDWALALLVSNALFRGDNAATLIFFGLTQFVLVATAGGSFGHFFLGLRVRSLTGKAITLRSSLLRIGLILLVIPAVIWDDDNRGLHDKAAKTVLVRR